MKTGYTERSGHSLVAAATRGGRTLAVVVIGTSDPVGVASAALDKAFPGSRAGASATGDTLGTVGLAAAVLPNPPRGRTRCSSRRGCRRSRVVQRLVPSWRPWRSCWRCSPVESCGVSELSYESNRGRGDTMAEEAPSEAGDDQVVDVGLGDAKQISSELAAVDRALARIEAGDYGDCTDCGTRLDDAQLAADPTATVCPGHLGLEHAPERSVEQAPAIDGAPTAS